MIYSIAYSKSIDKILKKWKKSSQGILLLMIELSINIYDEIVVVEVIQLEEHYNDK